VEGAVPRGGGCPREAGAKPAVYQNRVAKLLPKYFKEKKMAKKKGITVLFAAAFCGVFIVVGCGTPVMPAKSSAAGPSPAGNASIIGYDSALLSNVIRITDNGFRKDSVRVSPDGSKILYCEAAAAKVDASVAFDDFSVMLLRDANLPSKTPIVREPSFGPVWYDDGENFVYVVYEAKSSRLVKSNATGGGKTYITRTALGDYDARPSIKGHVILCESGINGERQIFRLVDDGSEISQLGAGHSPSWHPTEDKFVFIRNGNVCEMDLQTNQVSEIYTAATDSKRKAIESCSQPSYSPDGNYILFAKGADDSIVAVTKTSLNLNPLTMFSKKGEKDRLHLFLIGANGTGLTQLTSGNVDVFSPSWGTNNKIFFIANVQNATEIWKARLSI
jgi:TolB protein